MVNMDNDMLYNIEVISKLISEMEVEPTDKPVETCNNEFYQYLQSYPNEELQNMHNAICQKTESNKALYERIWMLLITKDFMKNGINDANREEFEYHRNQYELAIKSLTN